VVQKCFKRFDRSFSGEEKVAAPAMTSYGIDTDWYANFGATGHITSDLDMLFVRDKYGGNDQVHTVILPTAQVSRSNILVALLYIYPLVILF
jgi:hypothetical protein